MIEARVRIQFVSDIHLEMYKSTGALGSDFLLPGQAEFLALCGDIGYPEDAILEEFLRFCSRNYNMVFWVPGNHEYYSPTGQMTIRDKIQKMESLSLKFSNIIILDGRGYNVPGTQLRFIGCTLWSHIPEDFKEAAQRYMNDYRLIYKAPGQAITVDDVNEWHRNDRQWIEAQIQAANDSGRELIILTHHLPTQHLVHQKYEGHPLNVCFATTLDPIIRFPIRAWLCGHSHTANEARVNNVLCALNPGGYHGFEDTHLDRQKILTIILRNEDSQYDFHEDTYITGQDYIDTSSSEEE